MNRKERKAKVRGRHSATNDLAPRTSSRRAPFTYRKIEENPLYDQVVKKMNLDPLQGEIGFKKTDIMAGIRYRDTRVPIYGVNVPHPWGKPHEEL